MAKKKNHTQKQTSKRTKTEEKVKKSLDKFMKRHKDAMDKLAYD